MTTRRLFFITLTLAWAALAGIFLATTRNPVSAYAARQAFWLHEASGSRLYAAGQYALAAREYTAMIALRPERMDGYQMRGRAYARLGRLREAEQDDTAALARVEATEIARGAAPQERREAAAALYDQRGRIRAGLGQYDQSIADLTRAIHLWPQIPGTHEARMAAAYRAHRFADAAADADSVLSHHDGDPGAAYAVRGRIAARRGHFGRAAGDLARACQIQPGVADDWFDLGWYRLRAGDADGAVAAYREALVRDPDRASGWFRLAFAYLARNDPDAAMDAVNAALPRSRFADRAAARRDLADVRSDYPAAIDNFDRGAGWLREMPTGGSDN